MGVAGEAEPPYHSPQKTAPQPCLRLDMHSSYFLTQGMYDHFPPFLFIVISSEG